MEDQAFDARRAWMSEEAPLERWRTVSLVAGVRALLDLDERRTADSIATIRAALDELTRRGIDGDSLLRYGLLPEVIVPLLIAKAVPAVAEQLGGDGTAHGLGDAAWEDVLAGTVTEQAAEDPPEFPEEREALNFIMRVVPWVLYAPIDALLTFTAPSRDSYIEACRQAPPDMELVAAYRWLVDRFSTTHLSDWSPESLTLEFRWITGALPPPCPPELLADRVVTREEVAVEMAKRRVRGDDARDAGMEMLAHKMQPQARQLLRDGRHREAAALFEFAATSSDHDAHAHNNLGFCLIRDDPDKALAHLRRARELGYDPAVINYYNEALCLAVAGRERAALSVAEEYWSATNATPTTPALLWVRKRGTLALDEVGDAHLALVELCTELAHAIGDQSSELRWSSRLAG